MSATPAAVAPTWSCVACRRPIADQYFLAGGTKIVCPECRARVQTAPTGSLGPALAKATALGLGGAILASAVWAAIVIATNMLIGIVAIAVGFLVGAAVRKGAGRHSGGVFQAIAMILTVCSLSWATIPMVYSALTAKYGSFTYQTPTPGSPVMKLEVTRKGDLVADGAPLPADQLAVKLDELQAKGGGVWWYREGREQGEPPTDGANEAWKTIGSHHVPLLPIATANDFARDPSNPPAAPPKPSPLVLGRGLLLMSFVVYGSSLTHDPFSIVFLAIALYQAWKLNRRRAIAFTGPHLRTGAIDFSAP